MASICILFELARHITRDTKVATDYEAKFHAVEEVARVQLKWHPGYIFVKLRFMNLDT